MQSEVRGNERSDVQLGQTCEQAETRDCGVEQEGARKSLAVGGEGESQGEAPRPRVPTPVRGRGDGWMLDMLLDGILGYGISAGSGAVLFAGSLSVESAQVGSCVFGTIAILIAALALLVGQCFTDFLEQSNGRVALLVVYLLSMVGSALSMLAGTSWLTPLVASVSIAATTFLYGSFLCYLPRKSLMLVVDVMFIYAGCAFLVFGRLPGESASMAVAVAVLIAIVFTLSYYRQADQRHVVISAKDSRERNIKLKGNYHTLFLVGFMAAGALFALNIDVERELALAVESGAVACAGVFSVLMRGFDEKEFKERLKKTMGLFSVLFLCPIPFAPTLVQLVLIACYTFVTMLNVIILLNAVVETARFEIISPMWLLGKEGSVFFSGAAVGSILFYAVPTTAGVSMWTMGAVCVVAAVVCSFFQLQVNYQIYPFEPVFADEKEGTYEGFEADALEGEQETPRKGMWQRKYEAACERYKLSPRERDIFHILIKGRDTKYVMDEFCISQSTAKTHIYNIYRKLDVHSRQDLIDVVENIELVDDAETSQ